MDRPNGRVNFDWKRYRTRIQRKIQRFQILKGKFINNKKNTMTDIFTIDIIVRVEYIIL